MTTESVERLTTINRQDKAVLIWAIADKFVGVYKPHEYGNVILPMCVIKRFEDTLSPTRQAVWDKEKEFKDGGRTDEVLCAPFLCRAAKQQFYNTSRSEQRAHEQGVKPADRALLKQISEAWRNHIPPHVTLPDVSFFIELGEHEQELMTKILGGKE